MTASVFLSFGETDRCKKEVLNKDNKSDNDQQVDPYLNKAKNHIENMCKRIKDAVTKQRTNYI